MYSIYTDTDCDIIPSMAKEFGYKLIYMPYIENEEEIYPFKGMVDEFDYHSYYDKMRKGKMMSTCGLSSEMYKEIFREDFEKGNDILYVHFSTIMSSTFDSMYQAIDELKKEYPNVNFYEVNTKGITLGAINIVLEIGELYKQGKSIKEILEWADREVLKFSVYFYADDLKFFARSGRVSGISAAMGNLIGIKPLMNMDSTGKMDAFKKVRGRINALKEIVRMVEELQDDMKSHRIMIGHADNIELAQLLGKMIKEKFGEDTKIIYVPVNPVAGAHCGPDTIGISFHSIHR